MTVPQIAPANLGAIADVKTRTLAILLITATVIWFLAALFIQVFGAAAFAPGALPITYALTVPVTFGLLRLARRLAGGRVVTGVAVMTAWATCLDGMALAFVPGLYGADPLVRLAGAGWLLWAVGLGLVMAYLWEAWEGARTAS